MKSFVFRLETVLALREREEQKAREIFGQALQHRASAALDLQAGEEEVAAAQEAITSVRRKPSSSTEQLMLIRAWRWSSESCQRLELALAAAESMVEEKRRQFLIARQQREALSKLKEQHRRDYDAELRRREESEVADFITARHGRAGALAA